MFDNPLHWDHPERLGYGYVNWEGHNYTTGFNPACFGVTYKQTPCDFSSDWHTFSGIWSKSQIIYFLDGKEYWSDKFGSGSGNDPLNMWLTSNLYIGFGTQYELWSSDMLIDYVRFYTPKTSNSANPPITMQNLEAGIPKSLELPDAINPSHQNFYTPVYVNNNTNHFTQKISPGENIGMLGTGINTEFFYNKGGVVYNLKNGFETPLSATSIHTSYDVFGHPYSINLQDNDAMNWLKPVNSNLLYFQSTGYGLHYYMKTNNRWIEYTAYKVKTHAINNCDGYINIDFQGKVLYKGTDNNLWSWNPVLNKISNITYDGSVAGGVAANNNCGCLIFYYDGSGVMKQLYWWSQPTGTGASIGNGWYELTVIDHPNIDGQTVVPTDHMLLDEENARVYFIGTDHAVYYYSYSYSSQSHIPITKLGSLSSEPPHTGSICVDYNNAASGLTLSADKKTIYYIGTDGGIWYYYNDQDPYTVNSTNGNWNKAPLHFNETIQGPIMIENTNLGKLYYVNLSSVLYSINWVDADISASCPSGQDASQEYNYYMDHVSSNADSVLQALANDKRITIDVFPNPSEGIFNMQVNNVSQGEIELFFNDVRGRPLDHRSYSVPDDSNGYQLIWNAKPVNSGLYFYRVLVNGVTYTGKLIKI